LKAALSLLESDFKISIGASNSDFGVRAIAQPRELSAHAGITDLIDLDGAAAVLTEMASSWLKAAQPDGVPGTAGDWESWTTRLPKLKAIEWTERNFSRVLLLRKPKSQGPHKIGPWPLLRWTMLVAWVHQTTVQGAQARVPNV
jgi:hypothetical protein